MRISPFPLQSRRSKNDGWATVSWSGTESKRGLYFTFPKISLILSSLSLSIFHPLIHSLSHFYTSIVPYSSSFVPLLTYIPITQSTDLSLLANSNPFFIPFSFARKLYTPSFFLLSPNRFSLAYIHSTIRPTSLVETPISRGELPVLLVRRNTNSGSQIYRFLIS